MDEGKIAIAAGWNQEMEKLEKIKIQFMKSKSLNRYCNFSDKVKIRLVAFSLMRKCCYSGLASRFPCFVIMLFYLGKLDMSSLQEIMCELIEQEKVADL